jgi:RNA polymerase sigma-70 factor (ECF subfamily)
MFGALRHQHEARLEGQVAVAYEYRPVMVHSSRIEELFWAHHARVLRAAYRVTGTMADAEDVAQAVFLRLAQAGNEHIDNAESYLYRAAINGALDVVRRRQSERSLPLDVVSATAFANEPSPERALQSQQLKDWLRGALVDLSPRAAEMFVLRYLEDHDNREIARIMATSTAVVAVTLHHARARLKTKLRSYMRGER